MLGSTSSREIFSECSNINPLPNLRKIMSNSCKKLDRAAYEHEIQNLSEEYRNELNVMQITPFHGGRGALLPVRADMHAQIEKIMASLSQGLTHFFRLCDSEYVGAWRGDFCMDSAPPPDRLFVLVEHLADRIYAGYENIYRTFCSMAHCLENCRFVIEEMYNHWVDEYKIESGELFFERGFAEGEYIHDLHDYLYNEALRRQQDSAWVSFCVRELIDWADFCLTQVENNPAAQRSKQQDLNEARNYLERAAHLGAEKAMTLASTARLHHLESLD